MDGQGVGRVLLLRVTGPLDGGAPDPRQVTASANACGARFVLLDATRAPYADSGGLRWLLGLRSELDEAGRQLHIAAKRGSKVWRNLDLLNAGLEIFGSVGAAWKEPWRCDEKAQAESATIK